jgi:phenylalanine-4-hydroxylase
LSNKVLPSTTFIRESIEFSKDPDIFHEIFWHCPALLDEKYSNFLQCVSKAALSSPPLEQELLKRLLWFTAEVGLIHTNDGLKVYGSSLISSPQELVYSIDNNKSEKNLLIY